MILTDKNVLKLNPTKYRYYVCNGLTKKIKIKNCILIIEIFFLMRTPCNTLKEKRY